MSNKIIVKGAREHNLKNVCFEIPKGKLIALTGPSGSGKSSIAVEVLEKECLRQFLESFGMTTDHLAKAKVDRIEGLSSSIGISQRVTDFNPRSTVGTKTGILTILRNLFAALRSQPCGGCGKFIKRPLQDKSHLTTIEIDEFSKKKKRSYFSCPSCGCQLEKLQMAHFSFNTSVGSCEVCKGSAEVIGVDIPNLFDEEKKLKDGGVRFWDVSTAEYYEGIILKASQHYDFPIDTTLPMRSYTQEQRDFLLYGVNFLKEIKSIKKPKKVSEGRFEGLVSYLLNLTSLRKGSRNASSGSPAQRATKRV